MEQQIPRRIIQTGKVAPDSVRVRSMVSNLRLLHPDYEYIFFENPDVEKFIDSEFPQYRKAFDSFRFPIQRYDFFRYLAIYRLGGFYFDLDVLLATDLSPLLRHSSVFPFEGITLSHFLRDKYQMDWEIGNYAFGAAPGHPFLRAVIDNCIRAQTDPDWLRPMMSKLPMLCRTAFQVLYTTGPGLISRTLAENPQLTSSVTVLFPDDVCDSRSWNCFGELGIHLMEGSWRSGGKLRRRLAGYSELWQTQHLLKKSRVLGGIRVYPPQIGTRQVESNPKTPGVQGPLVSILIPAFNAEQTIASTLRSALAQTWSRKEIIVVDDGSTDRTLEILKKFESEGVKVYRQENQGAAVARNTAYRLCKGDYIQWLDADDLLHPDKISLQLNACDWQQERRVLLSGPWGRFLHRPSNTKFVQSPLWADLSAKEWLIRKLGGNLFMTDHSWLVSRELSEAAGPWDVRLVPNDDDGEYFCRVLCASEGVRFVPDARVYYRSPGVAFAGLSYVGISPAKVEAYWLSTQLHIQYLRSIEDSKRVRKACINHLQNAMIYFYPERQDIVSQAEELAQELGGGLVTPRLSWKYTWIKALFGWEHAKQCQQLLLRLRWSMNRRLDKLLLDYFDQKIVGS